MKNQVSKTHANTADEPIDALLMAHGLRRTDAGRVVLGWMLAHADTSYTHAQLQMAIQDANLDRVTLYRLIDRLTQVGLLLCRVDKDRVRRYQAMPASVHATPHFECQSCHRDQALSEALWPSSIELDHATKNALQTLKSLGYQGVSVDFAVRGVCADCTTEKSKADASIQLKALV